MTPTLDFYSWRVFAGSHDISLEDEPHRQIVESNISFIHPDWNSVTVANDIALVKLPQKIEFNGKLTFLYHIILIFDVCLYLNMY